MTMLHDLEYYRQRVQRLEHELEDMTTALSQAWDQLVPLLQEVPSQAETSHDTAPILQAVAAALDTEMAGAFLFAGGEWFSIPAGTTPPPECLARLRDIREEMILDFNDQGGNTGHWAFAPIIAERAIIGVLGIGTHNRLRSFTAVELRIISRMAERAGAQFAAAQLAHSREREARMARDMEIASTIQQSIQPEAPPQNRFLKMAAYWYPARDVGGDAWGWVQQPNGRLAWFALDVAGKGLPAALAAVSLHTAISMALRMRLSPADALHVVNDAFYDAYTRTDLIATAAIISIHPENGALELANAGHPPVLIRHQGSWLRLTASAPPIGVLPDLQAQPQYLMLRPGDLILCYSDGFTEIRGQDRLWGQTGLLSSIPLGAKNVRALTQHIVAASQHVGEVEDDQTLITAIYTGGHSS